MTRRLADGVTGMGRIDLTAEERGYVAQGIVAEQGFLRSLASYLPYLAPLAIFAAYGVVIRDVAAIGLAFLCLLALNIWWIHGQTRPSGLFRAICLKLAAADAGLGAAHPAEQPGHSPVS